MVALPLGPFVVRVAIPLLGVLGALVLLALAALGLVTGLLSPAARQGLFAGGVLLWMGGILWGVLANARPLPRGG